MPVLSTNPRGLFGDKINVNDNPEYYEAVSPKKYLVTAKKFSLPNQFVHIGAPDGLTTPAVVTITPAVTDMIDFLVTYLNCDGINF